MNLVEDYLFRASSRIKILKVLFADKNWADVVRESQEVVELTLKALLRNSAIEVPRIHDVSALLLKQKERLPEAIHENLEQFSKISKTLRRDRELAFYGSEDLTPSSFYSEEDAKEAIRMAEFVLKTVSEVLK